MRHARSLLLVFALALSGCAQMGLTAAPGAVALTPAQQSVRALNASYEALNSAIVAADSAVAAGSLKGQDARNALEAFTTAKSGLDRALVALRNANAAAASGVR